MAQTQPQLKLESVHLQPHQVVYANDCRRQEITQSNSTLACAPARPYLSISLQALARCFHCLIFSCLMLSNQYEVLAFKDCTCTLGVGQLTDLR